MTAQYCPDLIFLNTTDRVLPGGRNVRLQHRVRSIGPAKEQIGSFITFDTCLAHGGNDQVPANRNCIRSRKRRKVLEKVQAQDQTSIPGTVSLFPGRRTSVSFEQIDPVAILTSATLHIRRMGSILWRHNSANVVDILRCRQWSCVSLCSYQQGQTAYLDGAMRCVAAKLRLLAFDNISPLFVLSLYDQTLHCLREALQQGDLGLDGAKLINAMRLLAVYEMLDGLENNMWLKHIDGARSMLSLRLLPGNTIRSPHRSPFAQGAPLYTDVLLRGNDDVDGISSIENNAWRGTVRSIMAQPQAISQLGKDLALCLYELPNLLQLAENVSGTATIKERLDVLTRASDMKSQISDHCVAEAGEPLVSCDILGLKLAGMIALDRVITDMLPNKLWAPRLHLDATDELCLKMLDMEQARFDVRRAIGSLFG